MGDIPLARLLELINDATGALATLSLGQVVQFLTLAARLKDDILLTQPPLLSGSDPPDVLPPTVNDFLQKVSIFETPPNPSVRAVRPQPLSTFPDVFPVPLCC
jgi:hypothetical protein